MNQRRDGRLWGPILVLVTQTHPFIAARFRIYILSMRNSGVSFPILRLNIGFAVCNFSYAQPIITCKGNYITL